MRGQMGRRASRSALVALTGALILIGGSFAPANAATGWDRCPKGKFCVFENANGQGRYAYFAEGASDLTIPIGGFVFNDRISSVWNNTTQPDGWCLYQDVRGGRPLALMRGNFRTKTNLLSAHNDRVSSLHILGGCAGAYIYQ